MGRLDKKIPSITKIITPVTHHYMIHFLYCIYQILVFIPLLILSTIITALTVGIGTAIGDASYWGTLHSREG